LGRALLGLIEKLGKSTDGLPIEFAIESVPPGISGDAVIEPPVLPSIPGMLFVKPVGATLDNPSVPSLKFEGNEGGCGNPCEHPPPQTPLLGFIVYLGLNDIILGSRGETKEGPPVGDVVIPPGLANACTSLCKPKTKSTRSSKSTSCLSVVSRIFEADKYIVFFAINIILSFFA
jgi:hypothetical protein